MFDKKVLIIDIDDTIINFGPHWIYRLNERYGTNVNYNDVDCWDVSRFFPTLTKEQVYSIITESDFYKDVPIIYEAYYYLKLLKEEGYKIVLCSSSSYKNLQNKLEDCVFKWFDFLSWENVVICKDKSVIKGDVMIDDGVHNLWNFDGVKIMPNKPHNQDAYIRSLVASEEDVNIANSIIRNYTWEEIYNTVHKECPINEK